MFLERSSAEQILKKPANNINIVHNVQQRKFCSRNEHTINMTQNMSYWSYIQLIEHNFHIAARYNKVIAYFTYTIFKQHCTQGGTMVRLANANLPKQDQVKILQNVQKSKNLKFVDVGMREVHISQQRRQQTINNLIVKKDK